MQKNKQSQNEAFASCTELFCFLVSLCSCSFTLLTFETLQLSLTLKVSESSCNYYSKYYEHAAQRHKSSQTHLVTASQRRKKMFSVQYVMSTNVPIRF